MKTFSPAYLKLLEEQHQNKPDFGVSSLEYAPMVAELINANNISTVLDYGAGEGRLQQAVQPYLNHDVTMQMYDPAVPTFSERPQAQQMVCCINVLQCVEPEYIDSVLDDLKNLTGEMAYFTIPTGPADMDLSDGRNAALTQQPPEWWLPRLMERFKLWYFSRVPGGFVVVLEAMDRKPAGSSVQ
ncbi:hypothetical protein BTA51_08210 [Hahella sp. CCB-MM4]|uniref:hypothetical protein n=1 Tax=Hahella sp. (strain CCB-MM4) TaxID=1926491 RepID=UPI000B9B1C34|nr:hypothetical protein [Hahella sp. CCB-MM4]OZG73784.1 hypothetical protein BTA51_08210 [Hahella sp. CCB-MM4]